MGWTVLGSDSFCETECAKAAGRAGLDWFVSAETGADGSLIQCCVRNSVHAVDVRRSAVAVTTEQVWQTTYRLSENGQRPALAAVRERVGGS